MNAESHRSPLERIVRWLRAERDAMLYGREQMTVAQLQRRLKRGERWVFGYPECLDCRRPIERNDDAGVCTDCGGRNLLVKPT